MISINEYMQRALRNKHRIFRYIPGMKYNLNIVGWRTKDSKPNEFNDWISVYWQDKKVWNAHHWKATTLPGVPWLKVPMLSKGTAILVPGQYRNAYALGYFKGYKALRQVAPVSVFRDNNRDDTINLNPDSIDTGLFGIHVHKAGRRTKFVGLSSAGCQVFQESTDFSSFIGLCELATKDWGNRFSYTLMEI